MLKAKPYTPIKVRRFLFGEIEEYLRVVLLRHSVMKTVRTKYIQDHGNGKYREPHKNGVKLLE